MAKIVLASGSPRRQELLRRMGITEFDIRVPEVEEYYPDHLSPEEIVKFISREKSDAAARLCRDDEIVITADTMVFLDERRLGKPRDEAQALEMLTALAGRKHTVYRRDRAPGSEDLHRRPAHGCVLPPGHGAGAARLHPHRRAHGQGRRLRRAGQGRAAGGAH